MSKCNEIIPYGNHSLLFQLWWQEPESYSVAPWKMVFLYLKDVWKVNS